MWTWLVVWALLLVASGAYLARRCWQLWQQVKALMTELQRAQARWQDVQGQLELLGERITSPDDLAVFTAAGVVRAEHDRARHDARRARAARRARRRPAWARGIH